jgi:hypothetical protein
MSAVAKARLVINGQEVTNSMDQVRRKIREVKKEMNNLEVGTAKYAKKEKDLMKLEGRLSEIALRQRTITKSAKETAAQNKKLAGSFAQMSPYSGMLGQWVNLFQSAKMAIGTNVKALGRLKVALMSTGIGAIVVVLGSLITYLTSTQEGMDKITSVTRPLRAIFQSVLGVIQKLGKLGFDRLAEAISNPKQALQDLWQFIKDQFMARIQSLGILAQGVAKIFKGEFSEGAKLMADGAIQMATGIENATDKIKGAAVATAEFISDAAAAGTQLDQMTKQMEKMELDMITRRAELNVQYQKSRELSMDASLTEQERIAAARRAIDAQNELLKMEQDFMNVKIDRMKLEHSLNDTSREDEKELAQLIAQRTEFEASAAKKRMTVNSTLNALLKAQNKARFEEEQRLEEEAQMRKQRQVEMANLELASVRTIELESLAQHEGLKNEVIRAALNTELENRQAAAEATYQQQQEQNQREIEADRQKWEARQQASQSFANAAVSIMNFLGVNSEQMTGFQKALTIAQIAIDTASAISSLTAQSQANPANSVTFGAAGIAQFAAGIARITANMAMAKKVLSKSGKPKSPKFALGGLIGGPSHAQGGIQLMAGGQSIGEMEGGEAILTKGVGQRADLRALVNYANTAAGGRPIFKDGGTAPGGDTMSSGEDFKKAVMMFGEIVQRFPRQVEAFMSYQRFTEEIDIVERAKGDTV